MCFSYSSKFTTENLDPQRKHCIVSRVVDLIIGFDDASSLEYMKLFLLSLVDRRETRSSGRLTLNDPGLDDDRDGGND